MIYTQHLTLDIYTQQQFQYINAVQFDNNARQLVITLTANGQRIEIPATASAVFRCLKQDGTSVINPATIDAEAGTVTCELTSQSLACAGRTRADISIIDGVDIVSTLTFFIMVEAAPVSGEQIASTDEFLFIIEAADEVEKFATAAEASATTALAAQAAAEEARDQAQAIVGGFANHTIITIEKGRMRGDVDGDGNITSDDFTLISNHEKGISEITDATGLLCADVNADGKITLMDAAIASSILKGVTKVGQFCNDILGNWANNPKYATEDGQFCIDIPITGMTANHSASVIVKGTFESGFFTKAECVDGAIRIYAKLCPIEAHTAAVTWGTGDGTAVVTTESEDLTAYTEHIANEAIHLPAVTADDDGKILQVVNGVWTAVTPS